MALVAGVGGGVGQDIGYFAERVSLGGAHGSRRILLFAEIAHGGKAGGDIDKAFAIDAGNAGADIGNEDTGNQTGVLGNHGNLHTQRCRRSRPYSRSIMMMTMP